MREFRALWVAELLSITGDQLARVALAVLVYRQTSSPSWTALVYALTYLPALLGGALLSGLADRYPRREVMVVVDVCRALVATAMAMPFVSLPVLIALVFTLTFIGAPFKAAQQALLPTVLQGDAYVTGLSLRTVTNQSAQLAGFVGGGALVAVLDPYVVLGVNAATFVVAAVVVAAGVRSRPAVRAANSDSGALGTVGVLRLIWRDRQLRWLVAVSWLVGFFVVPEGLAAPYAASLGAAVAAVGVLLAADPIGSIIGAWVVARVPEQARIRLITPLAIASGVPLVVCAIQPGLLVSVVLWAVSGACSTAYLILAQASFTRRVPDHCRAAATGLAGTGLFTAQGVAMLGGGLVADVTSPAMAVAGAGASGAILVGLVRASWRASRRDPDDNETANKVSDTTTPHDVTSPYPSSSTPPPAEHAAEHGNRSAGPNIVTHGLGTPRVRE